MYKENKDPLTGKVFFTLDQRTVTIISPNLKLNMIIKAENQILEKEVK